VVGHLLGAVVGHIAHRNPRGGGGGRVDAVEADPVADDRLAVLHLAEDRRIDERAMPEDERVGIEHLRRERLIVVQPDRLDLRDIGEERTFHARFVIRELEFPGAEDDDGGFVHQKGFDHELHG
jgi:hypothetical protein